MTAPANVDSVTISAGRLACRIATKGAQLVSFRRDDQPYLYEGDAPQFWPRSAPLLFPIIGRVPGDRITVDGTDYPMVRHGFARDAAFNVCAVTNDAATLLLNASDATRKHWPFDFSLHATYKITESTLEMSYLVTNTGDVPMPFSFGLHPAFRWPLDPAVPDRRRWHVRFPRPLTASRVLLADGLRSDRQVPVLANAATLTLDDALFVDDAIVLENPQIRQMTLESPDSPRSICVRFSPVTWAGIWSVPGAPFVCLEPWVGVASRVGDSSELARKEAMLTLWPGGTFPYRMSIAIT